MPRLHHITVRPAVLQAIVEAHDIGPSWHDEVDRARDVVQHIIDDRCLDAVAWQDDETPTDREVLTQRLAHLVVRLADTIACAGMGQPAVPSPDDTGETDDAHTLLLATRVPRPHRCPRCDEEACVCDWYDEDRTETVRDILTDTEAFVKRERILVQVRPDARTAWEEPFSLGRGGHSERLRELVERLGAENVREVREVAFLTTPERPDHPAPGTAAPPLR
jgi:hypothetical protein